MLHYHSLEKKYPHVRLYIVLFIPNRSQQGVGDGLELLLHLTGPPARLS